MTSEIFLKCLEEIDSNCQTILGSRNSNYASDADRLHNFRAGGDILGGTPAQACWGYMTKHLVALRDKVDKNDFSNQSDFLEKCTDVINYVRLLYCIGIEENSKRTIYEKENS